ncbi:MAG: nucleotidyltransferase, partial [Bacteroidota bacterium]
MNKVMQHIIHEDLSVRDTLRRLDELGADAILFITDEKNTLKSALTDGDIRRGLINGLGLEDDILNFSRKTPKFFRKCEFDFNKMRELRDKDYKIIPVLNQKDEIVDIVNFRLQRSYLP